MSRFQLSGHLVKRLAPYVTLSAVGTNVAGSGGSSLIAPLKAKDRPGDERAEDRLEPFASFDGFAAPARRGRGLRTVTAHTLPPLWADARLGSGAPAAVQIRTFWVPRVSRGGVPAVCIWRCGVARHRHRPVPALWLPGGEMAVVVGAPEDFTLEA
jgi:hypothetical protein